MIEKGFLAINPIRFSSIGYIGRAGHNSVMMDYNLSKLLTQNILYAAYHEAVTVTEISEILSIPSSLAKEKIDFLEDNGLMEAVNTKGKFLTNMLIHDLSNEIMEKRHLIYTKYAEQVCEKYIPMILNSSFYKECLVRTSTNSQTHLSLDSCLLSNKIYVPENDLNLLLWATIIIACRQKFNNPEPLESLSKHFVKRIDGGENIIQATISKLQSHLSLDSCLLSNLHDIRFINSSEKSYSAWLTNSFYTDRTDDIIDSFFSDTFFLYGLLTGKIKNTNENIETINELIKKEFLNKIDVDKPIFKDDLNIIVADMSFDELVEMLPEMPEEFLDLNKKLSDDVYQASKSSYPPHIQEMCREVYQESITSYDIVTRVLDISLSKGILKSLKDSQKKTANMILFCQI